MEQLHPDLTRFFSPKSIAIVGVSKRIFGLGGMAYLRYLLDSGFPGRLYPINPKAREVRGLRVYPSLTSLPEVPELVIVSVPAARVPSVLEECARIGLKHIYILSAGFRETGTVEGKRLEEQIAAMARQEELLIMGPNCMGPYCPSSRLTMWGAMPGRTGDLGIISQSGGITQRLTEYTCFLGVGVRKAASIGNATVLDSSDYLEFMAEDEGIRIIAMYLESVRDGKRLVQLVREVNPQKPIILLKGGGTQAGASTVASHTGTMAGEQRLWEAFIHQTGAIQVLSVNELVDTILAFYHLPGPKGKGIFLVGGGGGNSVLHADMCIREGLAVPSLSGATMERLRGIVPMAGNIAGNPLDLWATFQDKACLAEILEMGYADPQIHMIIVDRLIPRKVYHMPDIPDSTPDVIDFIKENRHRKPTIFTVESEGADPALATKGAELRAQFCEAGIPAYPSVERAVRALKHLQGYHARFGS
jgi:acyl-CoA synthetase (NDP forming)